MFDVWEMAYVVIGAPKKHQVLEHQLQNNQLLKHQLSKTSTVLNIHSLKHQLTKTSTIKNYTFRTKKIM
jgi:hypothetical protein